MDSFGIDFEQGEHVLADELVLPVSLAPRPGQIVLLTGQSGSGKSSLMRAIGAKLQQADRATQNLQQLPEVRELLVDALPLPLAASLQLLSSCGLSEAQLMLRTPSELSDGQRYRFHLAQALANHPDWVLADEYTATLDRTLARVLSYNLRKLCDRTGTGFLLATTHEDLVEELAPDVLVQCRLDGSQEIVVRDAAGLKKKRLASPTTAGSQAVPSPTGRTSLGGITAAITSDSSNN